MANADAMSEIANVTSEFAALEEQDEEISISTRSDMPSASSTLLEAEPPRVTEPGARRIARRAIAAVRQGSEPPPRRQQEPLSAAQKWSLDHERQRAEQVKEHIKTNLSPSILKIMRKLEAKGHLEPQLSLRTKINNRGLLELLHKSGHIPDYMLEEGYLDPPGLVAGLLLTNKDISTATKQVLLGPSRAVAKDVIDEAVKEYILELGMDDLAYSVK